jgi:NAD(P)H-flavin reductase
LLGNEEGTLCLTLKNYNIPGGLSMQMFEDQKGATYEIKGPMGKGLDLQAEGTYIAFTAGTGILVFVDLVAALIRKNLGLMNSYEDQQIGSSF